MSEMTEVEHDDRWHETCRFYADYEADVRRLEGEVAAAAEGTAFWFSLSNRLASARILLKQVEHMKSS